MVDELRRALRVLWKSPAFAFTAIVTVSVAIAANLAAFDLLNALLFRDIAAPHPQQLTVLTASVPGSTFEGGLTFPQFEQLQNDQSVFSSVIGWSDLGVFNIQTDQQDTHGSCGVVSGRFYSDFGASPTRGRLIDEADVNERAIDPARVAVISDAFWRQQFQSKDSALGQTIRVEGQPFTIVGVAPPHFKGFELAIEPDVTLPLTAWPLIQGDPLSSLRTDRSQWVYTAGRLRPGLSLSQAAAALQTLWPSLKASTVPVNVTIAQRDRYLSVELKVRSAAHGVDRLQSRFGNPFKVVFALTALLMLTACINLGALTSFRAAARTRDLSIRRALGAGWWATVRPLVAENLLLSSVGGALGLWLGTLCGGVLARVLLRDYLVPASLDLGPDARLLLYAVGVITLATVICSIAPGWICLRLESLSRAVRSSRTVSSRTKVGSVLVVVQVCLSVMVLTSAGVLIRTLQAIRAVPSGLDSARVLVAYPMPKPGGYDHVNNDQYYPAVLQRLQALPGIQTAAISLGRPASGNDEPHRVWPTAAPAGAPPIEARSIEVSPNFLKSIGIGLQSGRDFSWLDNSRSRGVALVSESLARRLGDHPIGMHLRLDTAPSTQDLEVVGIVEDAHIFDLRDSMLSAVYIAALQQPYSSWKCFVLRGTTSIPQINAVLDGFGLELVTKIEPLDYITDRVLLTNRLFAALGTTVGILVLLLSAIGVFGVMGQVVAARRRELGIRLALGARRAGIAQDVLRRGLVTTAVGAALGLVAAVWTTTALKSFVFGVSVHDVASFVSAPVVLLLVGLAATAVPAWRAAGTDPLTALRSD